MRIKIKFIFLLVLFSNSNLSFSQVQGSSLFRKTLAELKINESEVHMDLVADKALPFSPEKTLFVIPKYRTNEKDEDGFHFYEFDAYVVVTDNKNGTILNKFYEPNMWTSDAVNLTSINIDTGLYEVNEKTRAIGIRVHYSGSSKANPYSKTELSLFIPENNELKRILKDFAVYEFHGEWDTRCSGEFEEVNAYVNMEKTKTNGLYNLIITSKTKETRNIRADDDCIEQAKTYQRIKKLKFDGMKYH